MRPRLALLSLLVGLAAAAPTLAADLLAPRVAVAWDALGSSGLQALDARPPWPFLGEPLAGGGDTVVRFFETPSGDVLLAVSRGAGTVARIDPSTWTVMRSHAVGLEPVDVALAPDGLAWVSRARATHLLRLDLETGATSEPVDLSPFADADGIPDLGMMEAHEGRLFVQVRRTSSEFPGGVSPPYLAVVDLAAAALVDVDPVAPGSQAIALQGTFPKHRLRVLPGMRRLLVGATGGAGDAGGLELVDLDALRSLGLVIREADGESGADIGAFVATGSAGGFLVYTTDFDLSSHVAGFTLEGGVDPPPNLIVTVGYFMPNLVHEPVQDLLFVPEGAFELEGIRVFDATTKVALTQEPVRSGGRPTDLVLFRAPVPAPALIRGDCDGDGDVTGTVTDAVFLLQHNFAGGAGPPCDAACDVNGDGEFVGQVTDAVYLLGFNFLGGPAPPPPYPACGAGTEADAALGCGDRC